MVFSGLTFLCLFLPVLYIFYYGFRGDRARNLVLTAASLFFYAWGEPVWIAAMLLSVAVNYVCALMIDRSESIVVRKTLLVLGVIASLAFLLYFKYSAFFVNSLAALFGLSGRMETPKLPIGISFYTFQILTYTIAVYRGKAPVLKSPLQLLLYISCFPQLIAGPIVQYADVADALEHRNVSVDGFCAGFRRFTVGLAKKVLFANICGAALNELTQAGGGEALSLTGAWYAAGLYTLQIYYDFSAYSDMAIGLGKTLGFTYKENFDHPYASASVSEFWRRWHISLGSFFREYVYIPLGGNRKGRGRTIMNLLVVWALTGLWHGASWNFVLWGCYYGLLQIAERFWLDAVLQKIPRLLRCCMTLVIVMLGWMIFYYTDLGAVGQHLAAMFGADVRGGSIAAAALTDTGTMAVLRKYTWYPLFAFVLSLPVWSAAQKYLLRGRNTAERSHGSVAASIGCMALLAVCVIFLVGQSYNPFIYFRF